MSDGNVAFEKRAEVLHIVFLMSRLSRSRPNFTLVMTDGRLMPQSEHNVVTFA